MWLLIRPRFDPLHYLAVVTYTRRVASPDPEVTDEFFPEFGRICFTS
jgi:hypothetical protein